MKPKLRTVKRNGAMIIQYLTKTAHLSDEGAIDIWYDIEAPFEDIRTNEEKLQDKIAELEKEIQNLKATQSIFGHGLRTNQAQGSLNLAPFLPNPVIGPVTWDPKNTFLPEPSVTTPGVFTPPGLILDSSKIGGTYGAE